MDYDRMRQTALRLIKGFGSERTVVITQTVEGSYDPLTDGETGAVLTSYTIEGVIVQRGQELMTPPGDRTMHDNTTVYVPAIGLPIRPLPGDVLTLMGDSKEYVITDVGPSRPDGDPIYFKLNAQRADA